MGTRDGASPNSGRYRYCSSTTGERAIRAESETLVSTEGKTEELARRREALSNRDSVVACDRGGYSRDSRIEGVAVDSFG